MRVLKTTIVLATAATPVWGQQAGDSAITGGRVVDPASGTDRVVSILTRADKIVAITEDAVVADRTIDATGLVVALGFIDILATPSPNQEPQRYKIKDGVTFAHVLGRLTREEGHVILMEAHRKMTIMPAQRLEEETPSMRHRDRLAVGAYADITVFDPNTIVDRATYLEPDQYPKGMHNVGEGVAPGQPIRRSSRD